MDHHRDLPLRDVKRKWIRKGSTKKYMHYPTSSNESNDLTSSWTSTLSFWNIFETICSRKRTMKIK